MAVPAASSMTVTGLITKMGENSLAMNVPMIEKVGVTHLCLDYCQIIAPASAMCIVKCKAMNGGITVKSITGLVFQHVLFYHPINPVSYTHLTLPTNREV